MTMTDVVVDIEHPAYVTVTRGLRGYFAVSVVWCDAHGGFYEPLQSGMGSYNTEAGAIVEAKEWAECEGIEYRGPGNV